MHEVADVPKNKNLYNGKEYVNDMSLSILEYGARFCDPVLGRWNQIDPLSSAYAHASPYSFSNNNPILFTDFTGMGVDTTRIYDTGGQLQFIIKDNLPNEDHFLNQNSIKDLNSQCCSSDDQKGTYARSISSYYIGKNTRTEISKISKLSNNEGLERGIAFVVGFNRELKAVYITKPGINRTANSFDMFTGLTLFDGKKPVGIGHTHPDINAGDSDVSNPSPAVSLNKMKDYQGFLYNESTKMEGNHFSIIGSSKGLTIYTTGTVAPGSKLHTFNQNYNEVKIGYNGKFKSIR
jgi:RHS repeat-associated protein